MALAGVLYVIGAVGFEAVAGLLEDQGFDRATFVGQLAVLGEEGLEMVSVVVFLVAVVRYRDFLDGESAPVGSGAADARTTLHP